MHINIMVWLFSQRKGIPFKLGVGIHALCSYALTELQNRIGTK